MTEKRIRCDVCGTPGALEISYDHKREPDGAGGMETNYRTIDLCHEHAVARLQILLREPPKAPAECGEDGFARWAKEQRWSPK